MKWSELLSEEELNRGLALASYAEEERNKGKTIYPPQD